MENMNKNLLKNYILSVQRNLRELDLSIEDQRAWLTNTSTKKRNSRLTAEERRNIASEIALVFVGQSDYVRLILFRVHPMSTHGTCHHVVPAGSVDFGGIWVATIP